MYITRTMENTIKKLNAERKVLLVIGARQVGKTTMLRHLMDSERTYVTLDDIAVRYFAITEPELFLERYTPPIFIDEIQYAPQLLKYIKAYVESSECRCGDVWLAGSQKFPLGDEVKDCFGDDVVVLELGGLTLSEINNTDISLPFVPKLNELEERRKNAKLLRLRELWQYIWHGGMPAMHNGDGAEWESYYAAYLQNFLMRDVLQLVQIKDEMLFYRFLYATAAQVGRVVNYAEIAAATDVSAPTIKQWVKVLEAAGIVYLLEPFVPEGTKYAVKAPKLYFCDTGLAAYLLRWTSAEALERGALSSEFLDNFVINLVSGSYTNVGEVAPLYYFRNFNGKEIELVLCKDDVAHPLVIKCGPGSDKAVKSLSVLESCCEDVKNLRIAEGGVICLSNEFVQVEDNVFYIPAWMI